MRITKTFYKILSVSLILLILFFYSCRKKVIEIGLNQNIHHDDFEYAVTDFSKVKQLTGDSTSINAKGTFYLITFRVINKAMRVNHQWENSIAYIIDENGNRYENNRELQVILNKNSPFGWQERYNTGHGKTDTTILVFDLPDTVKDPFLRVRGEILMGDAFDGAKFKRMKVRLF